MVTVYITNFNYSEFIEKSIRSVLSQTYKNIEIIIVDDNSTDRSKEILEKLNKYKPNSLYDAGKISGITPSALFQIVKHKKVKGTKVA